MTLSYAVMAEAQLWNNIKTVTLGQKMKEMLWVTDRLSSLSSIIDFDEVGQ